MGYRASIGIFLAAAMTFAASHARASTITYDFTVTAISGPLSGQSSSGTFTFDSSSVTPGSFNAAVGLLTALNFTWDGITYTSATANTGLLSFDASGNLNGFFFGTDCLPDQCTLTINQENWQLAAGVGGFAYSTPTFAGFGLGNVTFNLVTGVPEPLTFLLFGAGLGGAAALRRRRKADEVAYVPKCALLRR